MIHGTRDFWSGAIYIFFGATAVLIAREYGMGTALKMGAGYFPLLLGALLILIGAISMVRSFFVQGLPIGAFAFKGLGFVVGSVLLFGATVRVAGLIIALPILVVVSALGSRRFRWAPSIAIAVGLTIFCVFVFINGLGVPLPVIGSWFGR